MSRFPMRPAALLSGLALLASLTAVAQEPDEDELAKRLGFYFNLSLERLSQLGQANGVGVIADRPALGAPGVTAAGPEVNADFKGRFTLGASVGFRLRQNNGRIELGYLQWDEKQDLLTQAPEGKVIANSLASPAAGYFEDQGQLFVPGPPDGLVDGFEAGDASEIGAEAEDDRRDGAEDVNFNRQADFIRFDSSDEIVGEMATNYRVFDMDYVRRLKRVKRFTLDGRAGLRWAALEQNMDLAYRDTERFAVFADEEGVTGGSEGTLTCDYTPPAGRDSSTIWDGDGDGELIATNNERDGDGFMDGNCNSQIQDELKSVETVSEDRIVANIDAQGWGLKLGLDGRFQLSKKWSIAGGFAVSAMSTDNEFRYRETFVSERDRYLNFIDWDFNGDGEFNNLDLDFDGSCNGVAEGCVPNAADDTAFESAGGVQAIRTRLGVSDSVVPNPRGLAPQAQQNYSRGELHIGQAVPESERNRDIVRETQLLHDVGGSSSDFSPILDAHVSLAYQFSKFAWLSFGYRATRWYGAGSFRSIADDVIATGTADISGDFTMDGYYLMLTVVPR